MGIIMVASVADESAKNCLPSLLGESAKVLCRLCNEAAALGPDVHPLLVRAIETLSAGLKVAVEELQHGSRASSFIDVCHALAKLAPVMSKEAAMQLKKDHEHALQQVAKLGVEAADTTTDEGVAVLKAVFKLIIAVWGIPGLVDAIHISNPPPAYWFYIFREITENVELMETDQTEQFKLDAAELTRSVLSVAPLLANSAESGVDVKPADWSGAAGLLGIVVKHIQPEQDQQHGLLEQALEMLFHLADRGVHWKPVGKGYPLLHEALWSLKETVVNSSCARGRLQAGGAGVACHRLKTMVCSLLSGMSTEDQNRTDALTQCFVLIGILDTSEAGRARPIELMEQFPGCSGSRLVQAAGCKAIRELVELDPQAFQEFRDRAEAVLSATLQTLEEGEDIKIETDARVALGIIAPMIPTSHLFSG